MVKIEIFYIILGLLIGFFIVYATTSPHIIIKYPTIDNIQNTTYIDENGNCYKYYAEVVSCSSNISSN